MTQVLSRCDSVAYAAFLDQYMRHTSSLSSGKPPSAFRSHSRYIRVGPVASCAASHTRKRPAVSGATRGTSMELARKPPAEAANACSGCLAEKVMSSSVCSHVARCCHRQRSQYWGQWHIRTSIIKHGWTKPAAQSSGIGGAISTLGGSTHAASWDGAGCSSGSAASSRAGSGGRASGCVSYAEARESCMWERGAVSAPRSDDV